MWEWHFGTPISDGISYGGGSHGSVDADSKQLVGGVCFPKASVAVLEPCKTRWLNTVVDSKDGIYALAQSSLLPAYYAQIKWPFDGCECGGFTFSPTTCRITIFPTRF